MANLIPPYAKKGVIIEYWIRVASVWFLLLSAAALFAIALHVPVFILIKNQQAAYESLYIDANAQNTSFSKIEDEIIAANETAALLVTAKSGVSLYTYINLIESLSNSRVSIDNFQFARADGKLKSVVISGIAKDRESLVNLSDAIEADSHFSSAAIPLSNLAKDSDIPFTINIVLAESV